MAPLSIVYPAYNEEHNIQKAIEEALRVIDRHGGGEVIVVNDGSKDQTSQIVNKLMKARPSQVRMITHELNLGYGATLRDGFLAAKGPLVFYTDSDLQFIIDEIDLLLPHANNHDLVIGHRKNRQDNKLRIFLAGGYNRLIRLVFGLKVKDIDCAF